MFYKILPLAVVVGICFGELPHTQPQQKNSNQAVFSQSFTREDVPLSYKYSAVHYYTTPTPKLDKKHQYNEENLENSQYQKYSVHTEPYQKEIQYVPRSVNTKVSKDHTLKQPKLYTKVTITTPPSEPELKLKSYANYRSQQPEYYIQYKPLAAKQFKPEQNFQILVQETSGNNVAHNPIEETAYIKTLENDNYQLSKSKVPQPQFYRDDPLKTTNLYALMPRVLSNNRIVHPSGNTIFSSGQYDQNTAGPVKYINVVRPYEFVLPHHQVSQLRNMKNTPKYTTAYSRVPESSQVERVPSTIQMYPIHNRQI